MNPEHKNILIRLAGSSTTTGDNDNAVDKDDETDALPYTMFAQPISSGQMGSSNAPFQVVGYLVGLVAMESYLFNLLPSGVKGITMVISNTCGEEHSFLLGEERVSRVR